jgi:hypothetical protein
MEPTTDAERAAELREQCRLNDLRDLRGPEFLRLVNLAHSEGLLDELIKYSASHHQSSPSLQITPEMIEAGFRVLCNSGIADEYSRADRTLVAQIFLAMLLCSRSPLMNQKLD